MAWLLPSLGCFCACPDCLDTLRTNMKRLKLTIWSHFRRWGQLEAENYQNENWKYPFGATFETWPVGNRKGSKWALELAILSHIWASVWTPPGPTNLRNGNETPTIRLKRTKTRTLQPKRPKHMHPVPKRIENENPRSKIIENMNRASKTTRNLEPFLEKYPECEPYVQNDSKNETLCLKI